MRADLLADRHLDADQRERVDADLFHLLQSWFNRGFLEIRRISWSSPASLLEKVIRYEAVHHIRDWQALRERLEPEDRRCFGFFHPALPDEPLIFVEVALTDAVAGGIRDLLDPARAILPAHKASTAIFYSISTCQTGLRGIALGHFLIKQVAVELQGELPNLRHFATLSPVPGFAAWLAGGEGADMVGRLAGELASPAPVDDDLKARLLRRAIEYFTVAKRADGKPVDPVARFHLGNGARLDRILWRADMSEKGIGQSFGLMVNYVYDLGRIEENHEAYARSGVIAVGEPLHKLDRQLARTARAGVRSVRP
jgi:malonyl-CoA decarboxylase